MAHCVRLSIFSALPACHLSLLLQRTMLAAGRTLFEVLRGKGLESLSGEALAT